MKKQNIKEKLLSNQIVTHNTKEKKAGLAELVRKPDANVRVTNFRVFFVAYCARVQGPKSKKCGNIRIPTVPLLLKPILDSYHIHVCVYVGTCVLWLVAGVYYCTYHKDSRTF